MSWEPSATAMEGGSGERAGAAFDLAINAGDLFAVGALLSAIPVKNSSAEKAARPFGPDRLAIAALLTAIPEVIAPATECGAAENWADEQCKQMGFMRPSTG